MTLSIMKIALSVITLYVVASMVPRAMPFQTFSEAIRKFVLNVAADDLTWVEHLNVGIKFDPKNLTDTPRKVLMDLEKLKALSIIPVNPDVGEIPDQGNTIEEKAPEKKEVVWVAKALHIVVEVATRYNRNGMALDFAVKSIVKAIKCKALMYIFVQVDAIKHDHEILTVYSFNVCKSLIHILDKVAVLKESIEEEFKLYQLWEVVASQTKTEDQSDLNEFQKLVKKTLDDNCELSTLERIKERIRLDDTNNSNGENALNFEDNATMFSYYQIILMKMFNQIPISTMNFEVWERFLKPKHKEPNEPDGNTK